jgi:3-phosphoshikimate 1-carboxyvinyltransferase
MDITIQPGKLQGTVAAIPSKSQAHRWLICAAFADRPTELICPDTNRDIEATADCLRALGAQIQRTTTGYTITPCAAVPDTAVLDCCESGSTLRFVLPIAGALGVDAAFVLAGRLPERPLSPLWKEMERMGCVLTRPTANTIRCQGKLQAGEYRIDGSVSSQFISGLLLALSLLDNESKLEITGRIESRPYIEMTVKAMELFGVNPARLGGQTFRSPGLLTVEGDWSNAAFFLSAQQLGSQLHITGLEPDSPQGDRAVVHLLPQLSETAPVIDASDIPDLVPILAVVAAAKNGATFTNIQRLRLKESDRVASVLEMLRNLGGKAESTQNCLTVYGTSLQGGTVNACGDHRIAMSAAIAATVCTESVTVLGAESVQKSYPQFWAEYRRLGGKI